MTMLPRAGRGPQDVRVLLGMRFPLVMLQVMTSAASEAWSAVPRADK